MKQLLLASTALTLGGQALAADLPARMPVKAPIAVVSHYSWTGCYLGGHIGAGWGRTDISEPTERFGQYFAPANSPIAVDTGAGVLGGAQVGCDYQFATNWVLGAAGDFSWADVKGQATDPFFTGKSGGPILLNAKTEWLATATARIGYAWERWLLYGKGGAAWTHDQYSVQNTVVWGNPIVNVCGFPVAVACNPTGSETRAGWTLGLGLEWAFADNWSAGLEFDHYGFGTRSVTLIAANAVPPASGPVNVKQQIEAVKFIINYRFGWLGSR